MTTNEKWQPIETAPKDGKPALFFQKGNPDALYEPARKEKIRVDYYRYPNDKSAYRECPESRYTHWMPLPEPPQATTADGGVE